MGAAAGTEFWFIFDAPLDHLGRQQDAVAVMESIYRISDQKLNNINNGQGLITDPPHIVDALNGKTGTWIVQD